MTKRGKRYLIIIISSIIVIVFFIYYFLGEFGGNALRVRFNLWTHKTEYTEVAQKFLEQDIIQNIAFNVNYQIINKCSNHPENVGGEWKCFIGDYINYEEIFLKDIDEVLDYQKIPKNQYLYYSEFLLRYNLDGIGKDDEEGIVEIEDKLHGLRYYEKENVTDFVVDREYLKIKKVDGHWFYYVRDWN